MKEFMYWWIRRPLQRAPSIIASWMPRWLVYYCTIRLAAQVTADNPKQLVPELTVMDALKLWNTK